MFWLCAVLVAATAGCSSTPPKTPLAYTFDSPDDIARAVVDGLAREDLEGLQALALTEQEFREHVWPELPASRPERNLPFDFVWGRLKQQSDLFLRQTFAKWRGKRLDIVAVTFDGETMRYPSFLVRSDSSVRVRDEEGVESEVRLFGAVMVKDEKYKLFSYVVD